MPIVTNGEDFLDSAWWRAPSGRALSPRRADVPSYTDSRSAATMGAGSLALVCQSHRRAIIQECLSSSASGGRGGEGYTFFVVVSSGLPSSSPLLASCEDHLKLTCFGILRMAFFHWGEFCFKGLKWIENNLRCWRCFPASNKHTNIPFGFSVFFSHTSGAVITYLQTKLFIHFFPLCLVSRMIFCMFRCNWQWLHCDLLFLFSLASPSCFWFWRPWQMPDQAHWIHPTWSGSPTCFPSCTLSRVSGQKCYSIQKSIFYFSACTAFCFL